MVMPRSCSSVLESIETPSWPTPIWRIRASVKVVLPWSTWAMIAMFLISIKNASLGGHIIVQEIVNSVKPAPCYEKSRLPHRPSGFSPFLCMCGLPSPPPCGAAGSEARTAGAALERARSPSRSKSAGREVALRPQPLNGRAFGRQFRQLRNRQCFFDEAFNAPDFLAFVGGGKGYGMAAGASAARAADAVHIVVGAGG